MNNPNRWKALGYAAVLVLFGGVIGAMIMSRLSSTPQSLRLGRVDEIAKVIQQRFDDNLELTPEQKTRLEPKIKRAAEEMESIHHDCLNRISKTVDNLYNEIRPELIQEQQQKLVELEADRNKRLWEKYRYRRETNSVAR